MEINLHNCKFCDRKFHSERAAAGHLAKGCENFRKVQQGMRESKYFSYQQDLEATGDYYDEEDSVGIDLETAMQTEFPRLFEAYLAHQREFLTMEDIAELESGFVRLTTPGKRIQGDMRVYLELCKFVALCRSLSGNEADDLIKLIKKISRLNGAEIPLPQTYRDLHKNVMHALLRNKIPILQTEFDLPSEIFGAAPHASGMSITFVIIIVILNVS